MHHSRRAQPTQSVDIQIHGMATVLDVTSLRNSTEFYHKVLGLEVIDTYSSTWALLAGVAGVVVLSEICRSDDEESFVPPTPQTLIIQVNHVRDMTAYLLRQRVPHETAPLVSRSDHFVLRDPDGHILWFTERDVLNRSRPPEQPQRTDPAHPA